MFFGTRSVYALGGASASIIIVFRKVRSAAESATFSVKPLYGEVCLSDSCETACETVAKFSLDRVSVRVMLLEVEVSVSEEQDSLAVPLKSDSTDVVGVIGRS